MLTEGENSSKASATSAGTKRPLPMSGLAKSPWLLARPTAACSTCQTRAEPLANDFPWKNPMVVAAIHAVAITVIITRPTAEAIESGGSTASWNARKPERPSKTRVSATRTKATTITAGVLKADEFMTVF